MDALLLIASNIAENHMLQILNKVDYWAAEDAGMLSRTQVDHSYFTIKTIQDAVLLHRLDGISGFDVLEVGGGHSRVLDYFANSNRCTNVDPLEGHHGGPSGQKIYTSYKQIFAEIGSSESIIPDSSFDIVFSISVVEHVPRNGISGFFRDIARIMRPGGRMVHLIDTYLGVDADVNAEALDRYRCYREPFDSGLFRPYDPAAVATEDDISFHPRMASNPDNIMNMWNQIAPSLRALRERAQATTYVMDAYKI